MQYVTSSTMPSINNVVVIPGFGSVYHRIFNLGICIPFFEIDEKFVRVYQLHSNKKITSAWEEARELIKINRKIGSQYAGLDPTIFEIAYKRIFSKIGDAMQNGRNVDIDFRVGNSDLQK